MKKTSKKKNKNAAISQFQHFVLHSIFCKSSHCVSIYILNTIRAVLVTAHCVVLVSGTWKVSKFAFHGNLFHGKIPVFCWAKLTGALDLFLGELGVGEEEKKFALGPTTIMLCCRLTHWVNDCNLLLWGYAAKYKEHGRDTSVATCLQWSAPHCNKPEWIHGPPLLATVNISLNTVCIFTFYF